MARRLIEKRTLDSRLADTLREALFSAEFPPGRRLTEQELAEGYGVSRGTARAALRQLLGDGLVTQVPYTGWEVATFSADDVWELHTLRSALEGLGARLAASCIDAASRKSLEAAMKALVVACRSTKRGAIARADFALHQAIVDVSRHSRLHAQYRVISRQIGQVISMSDDLIADPAVIVAQHRPIVDAILAGRPDESERLARSHNEDEGERLVSYLRSREVA